MLNLAKFYKHFRGSSEFCILFLDLSYEPEKSLKFTDVFEMDLKPPFKIYHQRTALIWILSLHTYLDKSMEAVIF